MAFCSVDYLYCSHSTCRRRFYSEGALAKHYGSFHGRPTCEMCGKKLKKSGKVSSILFPSQPSQPLNPVLRAASIRARCWIQVPLSRIIPRSTLFPTPTTPTMAMIPRVLRSVTTLFVEPHTGSRQHVGSMLTSLPHQRSSPSRGLALTPLPLTLMVSTGLNSVLPRWNPSTMTTTTQAAALPQSRKT